MATIDSISFIGGFVLGILATQIFNMFIELHYVEKQIREKEEEIYNLAKNELLKKRKKHL